MGAVVAHGLALAMLGAFSLAMGLCVVLWLVVKAHEVDSGSASKPVVNWAADVDEFKAFCDHVAAEFSAIAERGDDGD